MSWQDIRKEFPVLERYAYLNTGTFGPLLQRSLDAHWEEAKAEVSEGRCSPGYYDKLLDRRERIRGSLAALIGCDPDELALTSSTTTGCHIVVGGLGLSPDDEIVATDLEHHTFLTGLRTSGARIRIARIQEVPVGEELDRIASEVGPKTRLIALSHVSWMDGRILPVREVSQLGRPVLVDGAQSVACIRTDVTELGCDFVTFPGQKWVLGPDITGGVFIRRDWHERLKIALPSFYGHESWQGQELDIPLSGAQRFEPCGIPLPNLAAMDVSLEFALGLGEKRFTHAAELAAAFREALSEKVELAGASGQSTLLSFAAPGDADQLYQSLSEKQVVVRTVPTKNWIRASVGFWNSENDLDRLIEGLAQ